MLPELERFITEMLEKGAIMCKGLVCALPPYVPLRSGLLVKHR